MATTITTSTGVTRTQKRTIVKVTAIAKGNFQREGTMTAELRQIVETLSRYPGMQIANEMEQNVFSVDDFKNIKPQEFTSKETRVAWIDVPVGTTAEQVQAKISNKASLYRVLSNAPILTSGHKNAIARGLVTKDKIADGQVLRYPAGNDKEGQIILDSEGRVQYRKIFFWNEPKEDVDLRGTVEEYRSPKIAAELGSAPVEMEAAEIQLAEEWQEQ